MNDDRERDTDVRGSVPLLEITRKVKEQWHF